MRSPALSLGGIFQLCFLSHAPVPWNADEYEEAHACSVSISCIWSCSQTLQSSKSPPTLLLYVQCTYILIYPRVKRLQGGGEGMGCLPNFWSQEYATHHDIFHKVCVNFSGNKSAPSCMCVSFFLYFSVLSAPTV